MEDGEAVPARTRTQNAVRILRSVATATAVSVIVTISSGGAVKAKQPALTTQSGTATYYAKRFQGKKTASGVRFNQDALMAAHHKWPFGTVVRVVNPDNKRSVEVRIVDRLARRSRAVIDLSRKAARELRFLRTGEGRISVRLEVVEWGER